MFAVRRGAASPWKQTALPPEQMVGGGATEGTGGLGGAWRVPEMIICWASLEKKRKKTAPVCLAETGGLCLCLTICLSQVGPR